MRLFSLSLLDDSLAGSKSRHLSIANLGARCSRFGPNGKKVGQKSMDRRNSVSFSVGICVAHWVAVLVGHQQCRNFSAEEAGGTPIGPEDSLHLIVSVDGGNNDA